MVIESKHISEEYAEEYINFLFEANRLRKNPDLKVRNWFKRFPAWISYSAVILFLMILWLGYEVIRLIIGRVVLNQTTFIIIFAMVIVFIMLFFGFNRQIVTYYSMLQMKESFLQKERNVLYHIDENGLVYEDVGTKVINCSWYDAEFVVIQKYGCYVVPRDITCTSAIGVPDLENGSLGDFLMDQEIPVTIIKK